MNILFLTTVLPGQKRSGGEIVSQQLIDSLIQNGHRVLILGYKPREGNYQENSNEISIGERYIETETAKYYPLIWMLSSYVQGLPYSAQKYYSKAYVAKIVEILAREHYDIVAIDHAQLGWLQDLPLGNHTKLMFVSHNIEHELYREQMQRTTNPILKKIYQRESQSIELMENRLASTADQVWTLTAHDAAYFTNVTNEERVKVFHVPANEPISTNVMTETGWDVGLLGTWTWQPNQEGLQWFFECVYPRLPTTLSIRVAGKGANWLQDRYPNVRYSGFVPDAQVFITQAKVMAIPVLGGGGIQIKTLEAISSGVSIVATPTALRGITNHPLSVRVASTPQDFANRVVELISLPTIDRASQRSSATAWSQRRRQRFYQEVGDAIACN